MRARFIRAVVTQALASTMVATLHCAAATVSYWPQFCGPNFSDKPEILHQSNFGECIFATPALVGPNLYLRTQTKLYAFGNGEAVKQPLASLEEQGFQELFSAEALKQWRQCGPGKFNFSDGVATSEGGMGLWWYAGRQFTNFVLRGEFVQEQEIADSGVFLRFPDPKDDPWNGVHQGHEVEIGDPNPKDPTWRTGSIYPFKASTKANTKPWGQWNNYEITCVGQTYSVRINGELVTTWTDPQHRTSSGYIGLQNYNDGKTVRHRNMRIKELPSTNKQSANERSL